MLVQARMLAQCGYRAHLADTDLILPFVMKLLYYGVYLS